jgi:hypothetical protein
MNELFVVKIIVKFHMIIHKRRHDNFSLNAKKSCIHCNEMALFVLRVESGRAVELHYFTYGIALALIQLKFMYR